MVLERENLSVTLSESGRDALEKLAAESYDVVVMDVQMPEMDGFTATRIIRACESGREHAVDFDEAVEVGLRNRLHGRHQLIVALTAHAMRGDRERCIAAGMDDYLTKPFEPEQVMAVLRRCAGLQAEVSAEPPAGERAGTGHPARREQAKTNLQAAYMLEEEKIEGLLAGMSDSIEECLSRLREAADREDREKLRQTAHALKGVLLNLRLMAEAALAEELETRSELSSIEEIRQLVQDLRAAIGDFVAH